jgi:hypothetical protein
VTGVVNIGAAIRKIREWLQWSRILTAAALSKRDEERISSAT